MTRDVATNYVHREKFAIPREGIKAGNSQLAQVEQYRAARYPGAKEIEKLARDYL